MSEIKVLNASLKRLAKHPFYSGRIPSGVENAAEFAATVPLMDRTDLITEMQKPGYGNFGKIEPVRINLSPMGSSLVPVMQTKKDIENIVLATKTHLNACSISSADVCAVTFGYHLFVAGLFYQTQMENHGVACIPLGPGDAARTVDVCVRHNVTVLAGNPSFALRLIEEGLPPLKVFFAGGEAFTGNPSLYKAVKEAMPKTTLIDSFSLSEFLPVARTFPGGEGVHVFDELVYAEVIDPETEMEVSDGERGELVLTHLKKEAQPLLRYRTGDLTLRKVTDPIFGRTINLPQVVFGRTDNMVKVKGVKIYPSEIKSILLGIKALTGCYRLSIGKKPSGGDRVDLQLEGIGDDDIAEEIGIRFKSQTMISADGITFHQTMEKGPAIVDNR